MEICLYYCLFFLGVLVSRWGFLRRVCGMSNLVVNAKRVFSQSNKERTLREVLTAISFTCHRSEATEGGIQRDSMIPNFYVIWVGINAIPLDASSSCKYKPSSPSFKSSFFLPLSFSHTHRHLYKGRIVVRGWAINLKGTLFQVPHNNNSLFSYYMLIIFFFVF